VTFPLVIIALVDLVCFFVAFYYFYFVFALRLVLRLVLRLALYVLRLRLSRGLLQSIVAAR